MSFNIWGYNLDIVDILLILIIIVLLFILIRNKVSEGFIRSSDTPLVPYSNEYYKMLCNKATGTRNKAIEYQKENCGKKAEVPFDFRNTINNRAWCRLKNEEEIVYDVNQDSWCDQNDETYLPQKQKQFLMSTNK